MHLKDLVDSDLRNLGIRVNPWSKRDVLWVWEIFTRPNPGWEDAYIRGLVFPNEGRDVVLWDAFDNYHDRMKRALFLTGVMEPNPQSGIHFVLGLNEEGKVDFDRTLRDYAYLTEDFSPSFVEFLQKVNSL